MSNRLVRLSLPLALAALTAAGCGGSSKPTHTAASSAGTHTAASSAGTTTAAASAAALSDAAYHLKVNAALAPWDIAVHGLTSQITSSSLQAVANTATRGAQAVSALKPPPSVAGLQSQLVHILKENAIHAEQWGAALKRHDTAVAGRYGAEFRQDGRDILKLDREYKAKGVTL